MTSEDPQVAQCLLVWARVLMVLFSAPRGPSQHSPPVSFCLVRKGYPGTSYFGWLVSAEGLTSGSRLPRYRERSRPPSRQYAYQ
jgi:hypothetical protein